MFILKYTPITWENIFLIKAEEFSLLGKPDISPGLSQTQKLSSNMLMTCLLIVLVCTLTRTRTLTLLVKNVQTFIIFDTSFRQDQIVNTIIQIE